MSQKKLRVEAITNELEGASLFFKPQTKPDPVEAPSPPPQSSPVGKQQQPALKSHGEDVKLHQVARKHARMNACTHERMHERMHERTHASTPAIQAEQNRTRLREGASKRHPRLTGNRGEGLAGRSENIPEGQQHDLIETIRKSIKNVGREELYVRITVEEKNDLRAIVYQFNELYRGKGRKTSENEVSRIALKFLLADHIKRGEVSLLSIIQEAMYA